MRSRGMHRLGPATPSLMHGPPAVDDRPVPPGTLFVLGEDGGWAAPPGPGRRLVLGRSGLDVHVEVGTRDEYVSREHATLRCEVSGAASWWTLRNGGRLPIRIPDAPDLLHSHETVLPDGYTPLFIRGAVVHVVEVLVGGGPRSARPPDRASAPTRDASVPLRDRERLVLTVLFQEALLRLADARPLSWNDTARDLNEVPGESGWTERRAEAVVEVVRRGLAAAGVEGVHGRDTPADQIKVNLQRHLLNTATLVPTDLRVLATGLPA